MSTPPSSEPVQFFDHVKPGLKDGSYRLEVSQKVSATGAAVAPISRVFHVAGPRFAIDPADVHATFPPNGATGRFAEILPHVVLKKRLLPWERDIEHLTDDTPWMALLLFQDDELVRDSDGHTLQTVKVGPLVDGTAGVRTPKLEQVTDEQRGSSCQVITFASSLVPQILPSAKELALLAHARQVGTAGMPTVEQKDAGWFSVVVANRFPASAAPVAATSTMHLVSLEGFGDLMTGETVVAPAEASVRMVSLASWTFSTLPDPAQTFAGLAQNLAYDGDAIRAPESLRLRLPMGSGTLPDSEAVRRIGDGFVALGWHAPSGEDGFAWYRGPLTPVVVAAPPPTSYATADAAMIYDQATGVFDHRLATAWQAGRALAMGNEPFATALMNLRLDAHGVLEAQAAPAKAEVHARLAELFSNGVARMLHVSAATGAVAAFAPAIPLVALREPPVVALRALLRTPSVRLAIAAVAETNPIADGVCEWLGRQLLLENLPFVHLVPDARMLPSESIRFFYLDPAWLDALMDGALGIGLVSSRDTEIQAALLAPLKKQAWDAARAWRARRTGDPIPAPAAGPLSGFLLRSALASGWPGLRVIATSGDKGTPVPLLRLDHLAPGVLFAIFNGVPDTVTLAAPQEGLEFGVDDDGSIALRTLDHGKVTAGARVKVYQPAGSAAQPATIRAGGRRVLNIVGSVPAEDLVGVMSAGLGGKSRDTVGPALFAVQMVKGPEQVTFALTPATRPAVTRGGRK
jgi:hypothetical protein